MNDVARLILEAWEKLGPKILADPHQLRRRLARRRMQIMTRPIRAWCLALRASDRRINAANWILTPMHALDLNHPEHPYEPIEHEVTLQPHGLRKFCRPVRTDSWGEQVHDVAARLGVHHTTLTGARRAAMFTERRIRGLGFKHGKYPVPLIHSWTTLNPSGTWFYQRPDILWGALWEFLPDMIPDDFEQTLLRKPRYRPFSSKGAPREYWQTRQRGWLWLCPSCKKQVRIVVYPIAPANLLEHLSPAGPALSERRESKGPALSNVEGPALSERSESKGPALSNVEGFACTRCHGVQSFSPTTTQAWNQVVTTLTAGLLFGHEVQKPTWYHPTRKKARHRRLGPPAAKREAVFERLAQGQTVEQIALDLMTTKKAVECAIHIICKQERVKNRRQLAAKLAWKSPQPLNRLEARCELARQREDLVLPLILQGLKYQDIAHQTALSLLNVRDAAFRLYARHNVPPSQGRKGLAKKLGLQLGGLYALNDEIRTRLLSGQRMCEIAHALGLPTEQVSGLCNKFYRQEGVRGWQRLMEKIASAPGAKLQLTSPRGA